MIAVDTNVVLRLLVGDYLHQAEIAQRKIEEGAFVSHGVLMEAEWVMRTAYRYDRSRIADSFLDLLDLASVQVEDRDLLRWATTRYRTGADWGDLLHLIAARGHDAFATFDRALRDEAGSDAPVPVELLA